MVVNISGLGRKERNRRDVLRAMAAMGLVTATPMAAFAQAGSLRWGSSSIGSSGYVILEALANVTNRNTELKGSVQATAGTTENFVLMDRDQLDIAHTTSLDWVAAKAGDKPFPDVIEANQLLCYTQWENPPLVMADSDIQTIEDLRGRSYSPSQPGSGSAAMARILFEAAGIIDDIQWVYGSWGEVYDLFGLGQIDAVHGVFTNGEPIGEVVKAEAAAPVRALEYSEEVLRAANARNAGIFSTELTPDTWPTLDRPIRTPGFSGILGADTRVSAEDGYAITKAILDHVDEVHEFGNLLHGVTLENAVAGLLIGHPVNAGAAQYYKEKNVWRDDLLIAGA